MPISAKLSAIGVCLSIALCLGGIPAAMAQDQMQPDPWPRMEQEREEAQPALDYDIREATTPQEAYQNLVTSVQNREWEEVYKGMCPEAAKQFIVRTIPWTVKEINRLTVNEPEQRTEHMNKLRKILTDHKVKIDLLPDFRGMQVPGDQGRRVPERFEEKGIEGSGFQPGHFPDRERERERDRERDPGMQAQPGQPGVTDLLVNVENKPKLFSDLMGFIDDLPEGRVGHPIVHILNARLGEFEMIDGKAKSTIMVPQLHRQPQMIHFFQLQGQWVVELKPELVGMEAMTPQLPGQQQRPGQERNR